MRLCEMVRFRVFFCLLRFCVCFLPKWAAKKRKSAQNFAKMCKKRFYAIPLYLYPFCVSLKFGTSGFSRGPSRGMGGRSGGIPCRGPSQGLRFRQPAQEALPEGPTWGAIPTGEGQI